jgi:hypothetical protein
MTLEKPTVPTPSNNGNIDPVLVGFTPHNDAYLVFKSPTGGFDIAYDSGVGISLQLLGKDLIRIWAGKKDQGENDIQTPMAATNLRIHDHRARTAYVRELKMNSHWLYWDEVIDSIVLILDELENKALKTLPTALSISDILDCTDPDTTWDCKDIVSRQGLVVLGGRPKIGKTIFALRLSKALARGEDFLKRPCETRRVLILALEDTKNRLRTRLRAIGIEKEDTIKFFIEFPCLRDNLEPLKQAIKDYQAEVVVIDTVMKAFGIAKENEAEFGIAVETLHSVSLELGVSFVLLHHHKKLSGDDPLLDLRGHSSFGATVDVALGLYKTETPGNFKLKSVSRDGEALDLDIAFNSEGMDWDIDASFQDTQKETNNIEMMELLYETGEATMDEICKANDKSRQANSSVLDRLIAEGWVNREMTQIGYQKAYKYRAIDKKARHDIYIKGLTPITPITPTPPVTYNTPPLL